MKWSVEIDDRYQRLLYTVPWGAKHLLIEVFLNDVIEGLQNNPNYLSELLSRHPDYTDAARAIARRKSNDIPNTYS